MSQPAAAGGGHRRHRPRTPSCANWWPRSRPTIPSSPASAPASTRRAWCAWCVDLKQPAVPQVFTLPPVAAYRHRLVFDFYPVKAVDPLEALIAERLKDQPGAAAARRARRPAGRPDRAAIGAHQRRPASSPAPKPRRARPAEDRPPHHHRARPGPRRRGPRRRRPRRHARKGRGAADRAPPARSHQRQRHQRQPDARLPHARRRFLRAAARARAEGAPRAGRPVREHPCRRVPHAHARAAPACSR